MDCRIESERFFAPARRMGQKRRRCSKSYIEDGFVAGQRRRAENKPLECKGILLDALFMQNKPNFMKNPPNVSYDKSNGYENAPPIFSPKIPKPISPGVQMNLSPYISTNYEPRTMNYPGKNKANSNPIQSQYKANTNPKRIQFYPPTCRMRI